MNGDANDRVQEIFANALGLGPEERSRYISDQCGADQALLAQVGSLLDSFDRAGEAGFLDHPTHGGVESTESGHTEPSAEHVGTSIGPYELLEKIGEGGFGTVYKAEQRDPIRRLVALKIIKPGMDTRQVIARFEAERQALAMMDHPGIARVYDAGATQHGRPFFVMELVRGEPITLFCDRHRLDIPSRLELFRLVCSAVQHAHQKGVIHRDIKPSNVLVLLEDGRPTPKVIDFGIAKATESRLSEHTAFTEVRQFVGTPAYMSPEQAGLTHGDIDTRSDIYSLGALLYELMAGVTPFEIRPMADAGYLEIQRLIRDVDPPRPSTRLHASGSIASIAISRGSEPKRLGMMMRGDLDWIVMKALEKDRTRRYGTASDLSADIGRYLRNEPVEARPPTVRYRAAKFAGRHRVGLAFGSALLISLILGLIGTTAFALRAQRLGSIATIESATARVELARATEIKGLLSGMLSSLSPEIAMGRDTTILKVLLEATAERIRDGQIEDELVRAEVETTLAQVYVKLGDAASASPFAEHAFAVRNSQLGARHPDTTTTRILLADVAAGLGQTDRATELYRESIDVLTQTVGPADRLTLNTRLALLDHQRNAGPGPGLADELSELAAFSRDALGEEDPVTLTANQALANLHSVRGQPDLAIEILDPLVESLRLIRGEDHPQTILALSSLANNLVMTGRMIDAEPLAREAIERARRVFGDRHPGIPAVMNNLGFLLMRQGRADEALPIVREAVRLQSVNLGMDHPSVISSRVNLGSLLASTRQFEEATEVMAATLDVSRRVLGPDHPNTLRLLNNLGGVLIQQQRPAEARPILEESLRLKQAVVGEEHPDTVRSMINLATVLMQTGDAASAATLFGRAYQIRSATLGPTDPLRLRSALNLVPVLLGLDRPEEARSILDQELPGARVAWTESSPCELGIFLALASQTWSAMGELDAAVAHLREAYERCPPGAGRIGEQIRSAAAELADRLDAAGRGEEASSIRAFEPVPAP